MYVGFATHTGQRRQNQDNALVDSASGLFAVADGVGGGDSGEVASASVCLSVHNSIAGGNTLEDAIHYAHQVLLDNPVNGNAGYAASTIVAVKQHEHQIKLAWVGDSRIYLYREDALYQLSEDHSVVQQVAGLSEQDAQRMRHVLTQAVGVAGEEGLCVDNFEVDRQAGDCWLLCSDGLHGVLNDEDLKQTLSDNAPAQEKATRLLEMALDNGADDNVTLIVLTEEDGYQASPAASDSTIPSKVQRAQQEPGKASDASQQKPQKKIPAVPRSSKPWHYIVLGGVLAVMLFVALIWGL